MLFSENLASVKISSITIPYRLFSPKRRGIPDRGIFVQNRPVSRPQCKTVND
jgi:hypothetical protein